MKKKLDLTALLLCEAYWKRRHTIAVNKLAMVRKLINQVAIELERTKHAVRKTKQ